MWKEYTVNSGKAKRKESCQGFNGAIPVDPYNLRDELAMTVSHSSVIARGRLIKSRMPGSPSKK